MLHGETEAIARDFRKHYRSRIPHLVDFDYDSFEQFGAKGWPAYVIARHDGEVIAQFIGIGRTKPEVDKVRAALERALDGQPEIKAEPGGEVVCEDGICRIATDGEVSVRETDPCLAPAADGGYWLAWTSDEAGDNNVYLRHGESGEVLTVTGSMADDYAPALATGGDGRVWVAWCSNRTGKYDVYLRAFDGKVWGDELRVTESADDAMRPAVAVDLDGRVWVTYYKWNRDFVTSRDRDVFARWYFDGKWGEEMRVSPAEPAIEDHTDPVIAADPKQGGRVWIAWSWDYHPSIQEEALDTDMPSIFATAVTLDGPEGEPLLVGTRGESYLAVDLWPSLAFDPAGTLWCAYDMATLGRLSRGAAVTRIEGGEFLAPDRVGYAGGEFSDPALAIGADGTRALVWTRRVEGSWRLFAARGAANSGGWTATGVATGSEADVRAPAVLVDDQGMRIVFEERDGLASRIRSVLVPRD